MKLTNDVTQRKTKEQKTLNNNLTPPRANKTKKTFHRFLHRGKPERSLTIIKLHVTTRMNCDSDVNCLDGSDEVDCTCLISEFQCPSGACVSSDNLCDGVKHCLTGKDESSCGELFSCYYH